MNIEKKYLPNTNNILHKLLTIDKLYILNPYVSLYDFKQIQKRQNNSFYTKILKNK